MYNKTQLYPEKTFERHVFHRDQFAHYLRWSYVLKLLSKLRGKENVLDIGCGSANLLEAAYHNRLLPAVYLGIDVRKRQIALNAEKYSSKLKKVDFVCADVCALTKAQAERIARDEYAIICCFEVLEHLGKQNAVKALDAICKIASEDSIILISTPCYDKRVGAASNHIIDDEIGEFEFYELKTLLKERFTIEEVYGTFASQKDYAAAMSLDEITLFEKLSKYYDVNILSVLFAPLHPEQSRNCVWRCKIR